MMSLVDYASSSDDDDNDKDSSPEDEGIIGEVEEEPPPPAPWKQEEAEKKNRRAEEKSSSSAGADPTPPIPPPNPRTQSSTTSLHQSSTRACPLPPPALEKLPDASLLFAPSSFSSDQTIGSDHTSRVAAAIAESTLRKRESNGSGVSYPHSKHPRGQLPHRRNVPETTGGLLIPPQLSGRSNVVTEDINKLFVSREKPGSSR